MKLVVGLGNPGRKYARTRHNAGFGVVARLGQRWSIAVDTKELGSLVGHGVIRHERVALVQPQSFMNRSGQPVASLLGYYKRGIEDVVVVHDDLELPYGVVEVKQGGGHKGHNGLRDIARHLGSDFVRVRLGIGRPPPGWAPADYVLGKWSADEAITLDGVVEQAADAVEELLSSGTSTAITRFNLRSRPAGGAAPSQPNPGPSESARGAQTR